MSRVHVYLAIMIFFSSNVYGLLTDNGTCTNGRIILGNETQILNESAADFIKNMTTDNRVMAEIFCQAMLNETTAKQ
ncbi:MAG TPA: hypothetical protein VJ772_00890 [Nitrososphaeraceae archaeon]|nr:hypothetical protein [Nitrososphaeraceae archaeon]